MVEDEDPFTQGIQACIAGACRDLCPHPPGSKAKRDWEAGWDEASQYYRPEDDLAGQPAAMTERRSRHNPS